MPPDCGRTRQTRLHPLPPSVIVAAPGAVFPILIAIAVEGLTAVGAGQMVDGLSVYQLLVRVPPSHAALVRAEFFRLTVRNLHQGCATHRASSLCWWLRRVAAAEGLHSIYRQAQRRGNALIAQPLALQILNPLFSSLVTLDTSFLRSFLLTGRPRRKEKLRVPGQKI